MKALIVGLGSIGRRHLANLRLVEPGAEITVWHPHTRPQDAVPAPEADRIVFRLEDALAARPEVALVACPAPLHVAAGLALAREGVHLFVEKPLSDSMEGVVELLDLCAQGGPTLMVGYNLRFYRPLQAMQKALAEGMIGRILCLRAEVGQYLPDWRPGTDYRQCVSARRDLGGGALLELSHELDYVRWLAGEVRSVSAQLGRLSDLEVDVEDTAEITVRFSSGALGNIHLDMVQQPATRSCRVIGTEGTLSWDGISHSVWLYATPAKRWCNLHPAQDVDRNEMYVTELQHFLRCVREQTRPLVGGQDGRRVLEIALAARRSSQEQRVVEL